MNLFRLELTSSVQIDSRRAAVWSVFADLSRWTDWCRVCLKAEVDSSFDWQTGQHIGLKFRMAGARIPFNVAITDAEPGARVAWASTKFSVTAVRTFTFAAVHSEREKAEEQTLVTDHKLFTSPVLPLRLFYPTPMIRTMTESMLADLKAECERAKQQ